MTYHTTYGAERLMTTQTLLEQSRRGTVVLDESRSSTSPPADHLDLLQTGENHRLSVAYTNPGEPEAVARVWLEEKRRREERRISGDGRAVLDHAKDLAAVAADLGHRRQPPRRSAGPDEAVPVAGEAEANGPVAPLGARSTSTGGDSHDDGDEVRLPGALAATNQEGPDGRADLSTLSADIDAWIAANDHDSSSAASSDQPPVSPIRTSMYGAVGDGSDSLSGSAGDDDAAAGGRSYEEALAAYQRLKSRSVSPGVGGGWRPAKTHRRRP